MNKFLQYTASEDLLQDRVILITGAGQGLGRAAALTYAKHGATVILHGRKVAKLEAVYDEIEALGKARPIIYPLDFTNTTDEDYLVLAQAIGEQLGRLDGVLHNAAFLYDLSPIESQTLEQWQSIMHINLMVPFALNKACLPLLVAAPDASIIMTASTHGHSPTAYWGGFSVAKAGVEALVKILADEWDTIPNLRVNALIPGVVNSPQRAKTHPGEVKKSIPQPEDLMSTYLYLMGPDSEGTSGQIIFCQGEG